MIFLSDDLHIAALYREPRTIRLGEVYCLLNLGGFDIDWDQRTVALTIRSTSGVIERQLKISLDELVARWADVQLIRRHLHAGKTCVAI